MTNITRFNMYICIWYKVDSIWVKLTIWNETQKQLTLLFYCLLSKRPLYIINLDPMYEKADNRKQSMA